VKKTASPVLAAAGVILSACATSAPARTSAAPKPPTERCADAVQPDLDPGLESRTVIAGPVAMVTFRVSAAPGGTSPRTFKLAVRLDPKADATLRTRTAGTSLLFDREAARRDDIRLEDAAKRVRFTGCHDQPAVFVGAVVTTGPRTVDLDVLANGRRTPVTVTALDG
jgi:hypothetical protein